MCAFRFCSSVKRNEWSFRFSLLSHTRTYRLCSQMKGKKVQTNNNTKKKNQKRNKMHEIEISMLLKSPNNGRLFVYYYWTVVICFVFVSNRFALVLYFISNLVLIFYIMWNSFVVYFSSVINRFVKLAVLTFLYFLFSLNSMFAC